VRVHERLSCLVLFTSSVQPDGKTEGPRSLPGPLSVSWSWCVRALPTSTRRWPARGTQRRHAHSAAIKGCLIRFYNRRLVRDRTAPRTWVQDPCRAGNLASSGRLP